MLHEYVSLQGGGSPKDKTTERTPQVDEVKVEELMNPQEVQIKADCGTILALYYCHQLWSSCC